MKHSFCGRTRMTSAGSILLVGAFCIAAVAAHGAGLTEAELTQIVKDVQLLPPSAAPKAAGLRDAVRNGTAVKTGSESRAELTFKDLTITRLGANTIFSFNEGTRHLDLGGGAILLHVPKNAGGATITTAAITAAITGTTVFLEVHRNKVSKAVVLEGVMHIGLPNAPGESRDLHAGEMLVVPPHATRLPGIQKVRLKTLVATSPMITEFSPLPSAPLIEEQIEIQEQGLEGAPENKEEEPPMDVLDQRFAVSTGGGGGGGGSKFGALKTITNPNPYVIDNGTTIQTDPMITRNGVTDHGKIYRDQTNDGTPSLYFFGSTSAFDIESDFNSFAEQPNPTIAAFKFASLQINGNPTVSLGNGGPAKLALISEGGITVGGAGASLTFTNLQLLFLGAQNGSINLGASVAFADLPSLFIYARGPASSLAIASSMTDMGRVDLRAEGNIQVNANIEMAVLNTFSNNFLTGSGVVIADSFINLRATNVVNYDMSKFMIAAGGEIFLRAPTVNIDASTAPNGFVNASLVTIEGLTTLNFSGATNVTFGNLTVATWSAGSGGFNASSTSFSHPGDALSISSGGDILVKALSGGDIVESLFGNITSTGDLVSHTVDARTDITVTGNLTTPTLTKAGGKVTVNGGTLTAGEVEVAGNISANRVSALLINGDFTTSASTLSAGTGGIVPYALASANTVHDFTVATVQSHSAPIGLDFSGNNFSAAGAQGGFLQLKAATQVFSQSEGINAAKFDGKDDPVGSNAGDGGTFTVFANDGITLTQAQITATTGIIASNVGQNPVGTGGSVSLTTNGELDVTNNSVIKVSSNDPAGTANRRSSTHGGTIALQSDIIDNVAIEVDSSSQLLSLLENAAVGGNGKITLRASGATSIIKVGGTIRADKGAVDIRHTGDAGLITVNAANLASDYTKIAVLGQNGQLTIGTGNTINANTVLKLYAEGSSGVLEFAGNVTLNSPTTVLAAKTINVNQGVTVTINGSNKADVFTDNPNYFGFGGTGNSSTNGTFAGTATPNNPKPFNDPSKPALGPVGGP